MQYNIGWFSPEEEKEFERRNNKAVLDKIVIDWRDWFDQIVRKGYVPLEMVEALYNETRDPTDRMATFDRIQQMFTKEGKIDRLIEQSEKTPATAPRSLPKEMINRLHGLTDRELEVMILILQGHKTQTIANELFIAPRTVKHHKGNIYFKLEIEGSDDELKKDELKKRYDISDILLYQKSYRRYDA